jgi:hypothetical protein
VIRRFALGRPHGGRVKIKRDVLESLPDAFPKKTLARALGVSLCTVGSWAGPYGGLPWSIRDTKAKGIRGHFFEKDVLIDWMIKTGRVYMEEWPEERSNVRGD